MSRRLRLCTVVVVMMAALPWSRTAAGVTPIPEPVCSNGGCFDITGAMSIARHLSVSIGPRRAGSAGERSARDYLREAMATFGLQVSVQQFSLPGGGSSSNVVGKPAADTMEAGKFLLVGGHYDTVSGSPGANDNATGTAAVVDIARAVAAQPAALPVVFVAFGAEEAQPNASSGRLGSKHFVSRLTSTQKANLVAFINLDYVGYGAGTRIRLRHPINTPDEATRRLQGLAAGIGATSQVQNISSSDEAPFVQAGLNAGSLRGLDDPNYHTSSDTYSRLKPHELALAGRLAIAAIRSYSPPGTGTWTRLQQTAGTYSGSWSTYSTIEASGDSYRRSNVTNSSVTFSFNGTGIRWIGMKSPNGGIATVTLDEQPLSIDQYAPTTLYLETMFERELGAGPHTLIITVSGQRNPNATDRRTYVDAFEVRS